MGCNTSKSTKTSYTSMDDKKHGEKPSRPAWPNRDWDSVTDSQINTTSTYLDRTGASTCSLRREGGEALRGTGDGQEEPEVPIESSESGGTEQSSTVR